MYQLEKLPCEVFPQYLETEVCDLRLVLSRWVTYNLTPRPQIIIIKIARFYGALTITNDHLYST